MSPTIEPVPGEVAVTERTWWVVITSFIMMAMTMAIMIVNLVFLQHEAEVAAQTRAGVCSYVQSLKEQVRSSERYLVQHPDGAPAIGLSAAQIQQGIDKQQAAVNSLSSLHCG